MDVEVEEKENEGMVVGGTGEIDGAAKGGGR